MAAIYWGDLHNHNELGYGLGEPDMDGVKRQVRVRVGLVVAALASGRYELLATGMQDRLHQSYRTPLVPAICRPGRWARR